jgi:hypothetical protein
MSTMTRKRRLVHATFLLLLPVIVAWLGVSPATAALLALADGRRLIQGGDTINYTDRTFAAFSGLWLQPPTYAGGKAEGFLIQPERMPATIRWDIDRWTEDYPLAVGLVSRLYAQERS